MIQVPVVAANSGRERNLSCTLFPGSRKKTLRTRLEYLLNPENVRLSPFNRVFSLMRPAAIPVH